MRVHWELLNLPTRSKCTLTNTHSLQQHSASTQPPNLKSETIQPLLIQSILKPLSVLNLILNLLRNIRINLSHKTRGTIVRQPVGAKQRNLLLRIIDHLLVERQTRLGSLDQLRLLCLLLLAPLVSDGGRAGRFVHGFEGVDEGDVADGGFGRGEVDGGGWGGVLLGHGVGLGRPGAEASDHGGEFGVSLEDCGGPVDTG
mmetsp:Transcript_21564/g.32787  ORF Transcript_21564/g.32787 Transcript_21564/m.32787 type:complete len:200 (-) Transcript_21564:134-733(-)